METLSAMIVDKEIYQAANELIKQHGDDAPIRAAMRHDELLAAGDVNWFAIWKRILKAVDELRSVRRPQEISVH